MTSVCRLQKSKFYDAKEQEPLSPGQRGYINTGQGKDFDALIQGIRAEDVSRVKTIVESKLDQRTFVNLRDKEVSTAPFQTLPNNP